MGMVRLFSTVAKSVKQINEARSNSFKDAIIALNSLQTNYSLLNQIEKENKLSHSAQTRKLKETVIFLERSGVSLEKLDQLSVIHVSGTKGKGSTCAFCESILRHHGYKTGFYSSPHLVAVRERIRINGKPLNENTFTRYFWEVYNSLKEARESENDMPPYFRFLTVMAFNVFLSENVDVAIIEVGIGGEYDCTNILRQVSTVGITSLGIDHTSLLGSTMEEIAWQKAGIMKPGSISFTVGQQPKTALKVLKERAYEKKSTLFIAPPLESYNWSSYLPHLGTMASVQFLNASLAVQLANSWMEQKNGFVKVSDSNVVHEAQTEENELQIPIASTFPINMNIASGLKHCTWPGRNQIICEGLINYFLDGAHTIESLQLSSVWFIQNSQTLCSRKSKLCRILIFSCTGDRNPKTLLLPLVKCAFQLVIFCPVNVTTIVDPSSDQANFKSSAKNMLEKCQKSEKAWCELHEEIARTSKPSNKVCQPTDVPVNCTDICKPFTSKSQIMIFSCVSDTLDYLKKKSEDESLECHVFVTGSLHLIGSVLSVLDPELSSTL